VLSELSGCDTLLNVLSRLGVELRTYFFAIFDGYKCVDMRSELTFQNSPLLMLEAMVCMFLIASIC
jgi:hypothetical protein